MCIIETNLSDDYPNATTAYTGFRTVAGVTTSTLQSDGCVMVD